MAQSHQSISHKTVLVLDHGPHFAKPSGIVVDYDMSSKNRTPGFIPLHPLSKSLWTWSVECVLEYCRMVYDIFPNGRHISIVASDMAATVLNSWQKEHQSLPVFMEALAKLGSPDQTHGVTDVMVGLTEAISALTRCTQEQHQARTSLDGSEVVNRGRIICVTSLTSPSDADEIINRFSNALVKENKIAAASDELMPIQECELEVIDLHALSSQAVLPSPQVHSFEGLSSEVGSYKVGKTLAARMLALVQKHFDLAITTITGIPMKEEQNAGSSANYDVGILHCKKAHDEILCIQRMGGTVDPNSAQSSSASNTATTAAASDKASMVVLKWSQPRLSISDLLYSTAAFRISAIDVNSRPSLCLTNFLLNGRQVILEQPRKTGAKVVTHMLASHGGEIFIHCLGMNRSPLEDPPSISEGPGGRVTDYRIKDFGGFMRRNRLAPCQEVDCEDELLPIERAKQQLERMTRNYPMTIGETVMYNLYNIIDPLLETIFKPSLSEVDKMKCREIIYTVVKMEANNEPLPVPTMTTVKKGNKRDEQYRQLWSELECLVQSASDISPGHEEILDCIHRCRAPSPGEPARKPERPPVKTEIKEEEAPAKRASEPPAAETTSAVADILSPESPPPNKKPNLDFTGAFAKPTGGGQSLLSMWTERLKNIHSRKHVEFAGRAESYGAVATLYPDLKLEPKEKPMNSGNAKQLSGKAS